MEERAPIESVWWRPEHREEELHGSLRFGPDRTTLHLLIDLAKPIEDHIEVLHGVGDGRQITLRGIEQIGGQIRTPGFATADFLVPATFIGAHVIDSVVTRAEFSFEFLSEWSGRTKLTLIWPSDEDERSRSLQYRPPDKHAASVPMGTLVLKEKLLTKPAKEGQRLLEPASSFTVNLIQPLPLENVLHSVVRPLQTFLTLATGRANALTYLRVRHASGSLADPSDALLGAGEDADWVEEIEEMRRDSSRVVLPVIPRPGSDPRPFQAHEMTFGLRDIPSTFESTIQRWFAVVEELRAATDLYFAGQYQPARYLETRFLQNCQVAEIIHRARYENETMPAGVFAEKIEAVRRLIVNVDQWEWVRRALEESNSKRLRTRYKELISDAPALVRRLVGNEEAFAADLVNSRNYYTHYGRGEEKAARGSDLYWLNARLQLLIKSRLLRELEGLPDRVETFLARTRIAREVASLGGATQ